MTMGCRATGSTTRRRALLASLFLAALFVPCVGYANCFWNTIPDSWPTSASPWYLNFSFPETVTVSRASPAGTVIASSVVTAHYQDKGISCPGSYRSLVSATRSVNPFNPLLMQSGVPGVELKASRTTVAPADFHWNMDKYLDGSGYRYVEMDAQWVLQLIKTDAFLTGGQINSGTLAQWSLDSSTYLYLSLASSTTAIAQTCFVTTPNVNVPLTSARGISQSAFTGVGSTAAQVGFSIGVDCSGVASKVFMTVTDQQTPGNTGNAMALTQNSTATGLGIQILHNNAPVSFGPDSSAPGNTNQFAVFTSTGAAGGPTHIDLSARYIQTAAVVTAGSANGLATFTMSYQ